MPGLFDKKPTAAAITAETQLGFFWANLNEPAKQKFDALYKLHPESVIDLLSDGQIAYSSDRATIGAYLDVTPDGTGVDWQSIQIQAEDLSAEPAHPLAAKEFVLKWKGSAMAAFPAREDRIQISNWLTGEVMRSWTLEWPEVEAGPIEGAFDVDEGLPPGSYQVEWEINTEGSENEAITAQGCKTRVATMIYVGESDEAIGVRYQEVVGTAAARLSGLERDSRPATNVVEAFVLLRGVFTGDNALKALDDDGERKTVHPLGDRLGTIVDSLQPFVDDGRWKGVGDLEAKLLQAAYEQVNGITSRYELSKTEDFIERLADWAQETLLPIVAS